VPPQKGQAVATASAPFWPADYSVGASEWQASEAAPQGLVVHARRLRMRPERPAGSRRTTTINTSPKLSM